MNNLLKWRREFRPFELSDEEFKLPIQNNVVDLTLTDKYGQPVLYIRGALVIVTDQNRGYMKKFGTYMLDTMIKRMGPSIDKYTIIIDMEGTGMKNVHTAFLKDLLPIYNNYYPERVYKMYLIRINWFLKIVWAIVKSFIDDAAKAKFQFVEKKDTVKKLEEIMDRSMIPAELLK